jgi:hypothetical protein
LSAPSADAPPSTGLKEEFCSPMEVTPTKVEEVL